MFFAYGSERFSIDDFELGENGKKERLPKRHMFVRLVTKTTVVVFRGALRERLQIGARPTPNHPSLNTRRKEAADVSSRQEKQDWSVNDR